MIVTPQEFAYMDRHVHVALAKTDHMHVLTNDTKTQLQKQILQQRVLLLSQYDVW